MDSKKLKFVIGAALSPWIAFLSGYLLFEVLYSIRRGYYVVHPWAEPTPLMVSGLLFVGATYLLSIPGLIIAILEFRKEKSKLSKWALAVTGINVALIVMFIIGALSSLY